MTEHGNQDQPYRVVDRENQGWHLSGFVGETVYSADYGFQRGLADIPTLAGLAAARGPLRPVLPVTGEDKAELEAALAACGRKAITTLAAALEEVFDQVRQASAPPDSYARAWRTLMAGREGSWESEALKGVVLFGNDLNLNRKVKGSADEMRAAGPGGRVSKPARDRIAAVIYRWVTSPDRYTEVAETLACVVSGHADRTHGAGGWAKIADQWLQPGSLDTHNFRACYRLLYSLSEHLSTGLL